MERSEGSASRRGPILLAVVSGVVGVAMIALSLSGGSESSVSGSELLPGILLLVVCAVNVALAVGLIGPSRPVDLPTSSPEHLHDDVVALLRSGRKVDAIKVYRRVTGVGLAEAKADVERIDEEERQGHGEA